MKQYFSLFGGWFNGSFLGCRLPSPLLRVRGEDILERGKNGSLVGAGNLQLSVRTASRLIAITQ